MVLVQFGFGDGLEVFVLAAMILGFSAVWVLSLFVSGIVIISTSGCCSYSMPIVAFVLLMNSSYGRGRSLSGSESKLLG